MLNRECVQKSLASYQAALERLLDLAPYIRLSGSGSTIIDALRGENAVGFGCVLKPSDATGVSCSSARLFGWGPLDISPNSWLWKCSFFKAQFFAETPFEVYRYRPAMHSADGTKEEAGVDAQTHTLRLYGQERSWGVGKWEATRAERESLADGAPEAVVEHYRKALAAADAELRNWLKAVNERPKVVIQ